MPQLSGRIAVGHQTDNRLPLNYYYLIIFKTSFNFLTAYFGCSFLVLGFSLANFPALNHIVCSPSELPIRISFLVLSPITKLALRSINFKATILSKSFLLLFFVIMILEKYCLMPRLPIKSSLERLAWLMRYRVNPLRIKIRKINFTYGARQFLSGS